MTCILIAGFRCNSYNSQQLTAPLPLPLTVSRGQICQFTATATSQSLRAAVCGNGYLIPSLAGTHCCGASYTDNDFELTYRLSDQQHILQQLAQTLPALTPQPPFQGRAALRCTTRDHLPVIGPVPDTDFYQHHYHDLHHGKPARHYPSARYLPGLWLNTGHGSRGLTSAPLAAQYIVSALLGQPLPLPKSLLQALHPGRFLVKKLKRKH